MKRTAPLPLLVLLAGCPAAPASDDEAGVTTNPGSGDSDESNDPSGGDTTDAGDGESSTASTTSTTGTETATDDFIPQPDQWPTESCSLFEQDCPEGEKCVPYSLDGFPGWNAHKCVPILGDQPPGEPCTWGGYTDATDDCDATSMCWFTEDIEGALIGECVAFCVGTLDVPLCSDPGQVCTLDAEGDLALCLPNCDPVIQDCDQGEGCYFSGAAFICVPTTQQIPTGEVCNFLNDCAPGNLCVDGSDLPSCADTACCTQVCDLTDDATCLDQPGTACVPFFEQGLAPAGLEHVGVCVVPG